MIVNCLTGPRTQWHIPGQPAAQQQQLQPETFEKSRLLRQGRQLARNTYSPTQLHLQKWGDCSARLLFLCFVSLAYCASVVLCVCVELCQTSDFSTSRCKLHQLKSSSKGHSWAERNLRNPVKELSRAVLFGNRCMDYHHSWSFWSWCLIVHVSIDYCCVVLVSYSVSVLWLELATDWTAALQLWLELVTDWTAAQ